MLSIVSLPNKIREGEKEKERERERERERQIVRPVN